MLRTILAVLMLACCTVLPARAEVRIVNDPGGEVSSYVWKYENIKNSGERLVIDGPCVSACTLFTGIVPRDHVCVTANAVLGFHMGSTYDAAGNLTPTREGTKLIMDVYPAPIRSWIAKHGGLVPQVKTMRGRELARLYRTCT